MNKWFRTFMDLLDNPEEKKRIQEERITMSDASLWNLYWVSTTTIVNYLWAPPKKSLKKAKKYKYIDVDKAIWMREEWYTDVEIAWALWCSNSTINKRLGNRWDWYKSWNKFKKYVARPPDPYKKKEEEIKTVISNVPYWDTTDMVEIWTNPHPFLYTKIK